MSRAAGKIFKGIIILVVVWMLYRVSEIHWLTIFAAIAWCFQEISYCRDELKRIADALEKGVK